MKNGSVPKQKKSLGARIVRDFRMYKYLYLMALPMVIYYILFHYAPMYGVIIAFKNFAPNKGILGSQWVGLKNFRKFFNDVYFTRIIKNTIVINLKDLIFGFPAPIILALMMNEVRQNGFEKIVQTITYLPHFISVMVICGMIIDFTASDGVINDVLAAFGVKRQTMLINPKLFQPVYIISGIWQGVGWGTIIYLGALTAIDPQLYEAAQIDGAGKLSQIIHITIPGILPTVIIMLILKIGQLMSLGYEKIILLYNPTTYETADVISSYSYRKGLLDMNYSYSTAISFFNSAINFILVTLTNYISRRVSDVSLW